MTPCTTKPEPTDKQFYDYIVDHLKREHELADKRMGWMLTSQAFLFAAFGAVNYANLSPPTSADLNKTIPLSGLTRVLNIVIPMVGLTVSVAVLLGVLGTNIAVRVYRKEWNAKPDEVRKLFPPSSGWGVPHGLGLFSTLIIPLVVCFAWSLILSRASNRSYLPFFGIAAIVILLISIYVIWDARDVKSLPCSLPKENDQPIKTDNLQSAGENTYQ